MTHLLRHASVCLWITLLAGVIAGFGVLPLLQAAAGPEAVPFMAAGFLAAVFAGIAWAANRLGLARVRRLMLRADRAEREGLRDQAEIHYRRALAVLDSFLLAPAARRRVLLPLAARMARFYLSCSQLGAEAEGFIAGYLRVNPRDEEAAEQWVRHAEEQGGLQEEHQDLAQRLADTHPRNLLIQRAVARLNLVLERTDYPALQSYRRACAPDGRVPAEFCRDLARLLREEDRSDEWSQQVYRQAGEIVPPPARETHDRRPMRPDPGRAAGEVARGDEAEEQASIRDREESFRMSAGAVDWEAEEEERAGLLAPPGRGPSLPRRLAGLAGRCLQPVFTGLGRLGRDLPLRLRATFRGLRAAHAGVALGVAAVAAGGVWLAFNLEGILAPAPAESPGRPPAAVSGPAGIDPFTLQVAAYLKSEYALKFVEELKKKGLDAYWIETSSGGKLWYQVRIAHFPDQQSAREFGRELKWKGVIDDFYVTAYVR